MSYIKEAAGVDYQLAGTHDPFIIGGDTATPKDKIVLSLNWDKGAWAVTTNFNYVGGYSITDPSYYAPTCVAAQENRFCRNKELKFS